MNRALLLKVGVIAALAVLLIIALSVISDLIGSEDYALLMGALLMFVALTAFMLLTRRLDWYALPNHVRQTEGASAP